MDKFNVLGGSGPIWTPFAATGARMVTQTLHELKRRGGGFGLTTACAAGGLGAAMSFWRWNNGDSSKGYKPHPEKSPVIPVFRYTSR